MLGDPVGRPFGFGSGFILSDAAIGFLPRFLGPSISPVSPTAGLDSDSGVSPVNYFWNVFVLCFQTCFGTFFNDWVNISRYY